MRLIRWLQVNNNKKDTCWGAAHTGYKAIYDF